MITIIAMIAMITMLKMTLTKIDYNVTKMATVETWFA
jgi:hypothetical protein